MTDIVLNEIRSGYNLSKINDNFEKIENVVNTEVIHSTGDNNVMGQDLDLNSNRILNLPAPINDNEPLRLGDANILAGTREGGSTISEEPPVLKAAGDRWTRCSDMKAFLWYEDGDSGQWIEDRPSYGIDTIQNLSIPYVFDTVADMTASIVVFPVGKILQTKEYSSGNGGGTSYVVTAGTSPNGGSPALTAGYYAKLTPRLRLEMNEYTDSGETADPTAIQEMLDDVSGKKGVDVRLGDGQRVTTVRGQQTSYASELGDFTFPTDVDLLFHGPTRERIRYLDNINLEVAGPSAPLGVPVNELRLTAPYHAGLIIDVKTPAFYNGVKQAAHLAADAIVGAGGTDTSEYRSLIFATDGLDDFVWQALPNKVLGMRTVRPSDSVLQDRSWTIDQESGNSGFQINNIDVNYSGHFGGKIKIETGANALNGSASVVNPTLVFKKAATSHESEIEFNQLINALKISNNHATANGVEVLQVGDACAYFQEGTFSGVGSTQSSIRVGQTTNGRSISASGTINASGADYAEYMEKSESCGQLLAGDICGIDSSGKLTNKFDESVSFCIKSTKPSLVGNDQLLVDIKTSYPSKDESQILSKVDKIAFCGQVPVNCDGVAGDYVIPTNNNGLISGRTVKTPTLSEYLSSVGRVISNDKGVTTVITTIK